MVHIDRIQLRYFKSFRNVDIMLARGFVALVGPNGSGKSNICDGIRFALGENSLKALRAKKIADLITSGSEKAEIRLNLKENGKNIELRRAIRRDGKTKYRYNGKRMTRTAVMEALRPMGAEIGDHNVIAQGEVQEIVEMSAKERRGIIDSVSGISEFEDKRGEALRELEKVDSKISDASIVLKEREGFLLELEKEKNDALRYQELSAELHRLRGSLIYASMNRANEEHSKFLDRYLKLEKRIAESKKEMEYKRGQVAQLEREKSALVDEINRRSKKDEAYREIEELRASLKMDASSLEAKKEEGTGAEGQLEGLKAEEKNISKRIAGLQEEIKKTERGIGEAAKRVGELEKKRQELLRTAGDAEATYAELRSKLERIGGEIETARVKESQIAGEISKENGIRELKDEELVRLREESVSESAEVGKLKDEIEKLKEAVKRFSGDSDRLFEKERALNKDLPELEKSWLKARERVSELSARIGSSGSPPGVKAVLKMRDDGDIRGIYGTVSELCKFKPEYAVAIEASAGNRMEYVVVESVDAAAKAIERLKKTKGGRCTFIPLDRKKSEEVPRELEGKGLGPLINFVSFDAKYRGAMGYVFGGTLLVDDVGEAKNVGPGKVRMVTLEGDLFELSGIITGGMFTPKFHLKEKQELEEVEKKANALKSEREFAINELRRIREEMSGIRHEKAEKEVRMKSLEIELNNRLEKEEEKSDAKKQAEALEKEIAGIALRIAKLGGEAGEVKKKVAELEGQRTSVKKMLEEGEKREHEKELERIEGEISELKTKKSSLEATIEGRKNELTLVEQNGKTNSENAKAFRERISKLKREVEEILKRSEENRKLLKEREDAMKEISTAVQALFDKSNELEKSIGEVSVQVGRLENSQERANREMQEIAVNKATFETRLTDLKAEYEKYKDVQPIEAPKEDIEAKVKEGEGKQLELGNVNLRAPELYEERKRDMDDIKAKIGKLSDEKNAVMRVINEIEGKKRAVFMETFTQVNDNFKKLFKTVFTRDDGFLALDQPTLPFESGLQIKVKAEKNEKNVESMSGGEKSLITLLFVLSIHMCRPAPFYLLDEVEAALDKENSKKLALLVKELSKNTQFIMVTHNDQVLSTADVALGVTRTAEGSKVVGIQLK